MLEQRAKAREALRTPKQKGMDNSPGGHRCSMLALPAEALALCSPPSATQGRQASPDPFHLDDKDSALCPVYNLLTEVGLDSGVKRAQVKEPEAILDEPAPISVAIPSQQLDTF